MIEVTIKLPDLPVALNPNGKKVEVSPIGEIREGKWPFSLRQEFTNDAHWVKDSASSDTHCMFTARLIDV